MEPNRANYSSFEDYGLAVIGFFSIRHGFFNVVNSPDCCNNIRHYSAITANGHVCQQCEAKHDSSFVRGCGFHVTGTERSIHNGGSTNSMEEIGHLPAGNVIDSSIGDVVVGDDCVNKSDLSTNAVEEHVSGRGKNWERNQERKQKKREKKQRKKDNRGVVNLSPNANIARRSLEEKWDIENKLAIVKAQRQLAVYEANSVDQEVKKYRTQVCVATEKNMVAIETAHEKLRVSGNVALDDQSRVQTIFDVPSLSSGSISPNSSASMAEFRKLQKDYLDGEKKIEKLTAALEKFGISMDDVDMLEYKDKSVWTDNAENHAILDKMYPDGYGYSYDDAPPGKFVLGY